MLLEQPHRVARLDVLGEDEHADLRMLGRIVCAATSPSSVCVGGIRMSTIATSGRASADVRGAGPRRPPPGATTSTPASRSSRTMPSRSASRRRRRLRARDLRSDVGRAELHVAAERADAVGDVDERGVARLAVVVDVDHEPIGRRAWQ